VSAQTPLTLEELEQRALEHNPTLAQARSQIEAARGRAEQAGLWPNPSVGYTAEEVSRSPTIRGGEHGIFVEQRIPLGGKLKLSQAIYAREADVAEMITAGQRLRVLNTVRILYVEALVEARRVMVREQLATLTHDASGVSRQLANVGAADETDLLEAEMEAQRADLALVEARGRERGVWARLAQTVGDPSLSLQPLGGNLDELLRPLEHDVMLAVLLRDSPEIRTAAARVETARATIARARREPIPDLVMRGGPRYNRELLDPGPSPVGWEAFADIGISIPLFDRNQGAVRAAQAELARAEDERRRIELELRVRMADVFERYSSAKTRAEVYRDEIVPRAEQAYQLFQARYREMAAAYPQVLIAQRTLLRSTDEYLAAVASASRDAVLLEGMLLDGGLEAPPDPGDGSATAF
jgi:cobalt-zinc-cadmium efflux system outer membrane protein